MQYGRRRFALILATLASAALLWGCGSNGSGGSTVTPPGQDPQVVGSSSCQVCHTAIVAQGWIGSAHDNDPVAGCEGCHGGGQFHRGLGPIPNPSPGLEQCAQCHDSRSPGFLTRHSGDDPATDHTNTAVIEGYVFTSCLECHFSKGNNPNTLQWEHNPADVTIHKQWANSAHAGRIGSDAPDTATVWGHYNWDQTTGTGNRAACQRCHTATGAMNFLNSPANYSPANNDFSHLFDWSAATGSPQNELLYCSSCHNDVATGGLRNPGAITETYPAATAGADPAVVAYPDLSSSNVCMGCHLGREIGQNVKNDTDADGVRSFINSHYLAAGGMIFNVSGYEYAGQTYDNFGFHKQVGQANALGTGTNGPCVTCHMSGPEPHTFTAAAGNTACGSCHGGLTDAILEDSKHEFHLALEELNQALAARGIHFFPAHPYFYQAANGQGGAFTNWESVATALGVGLGVDPTGTGWKNVMGAAFNYNLIEHDPGAFAHNRQYALKLIQDSIDFLADGAVDGLGTSPVVAAVIADTAFAEATTHTAQALAIPTTESGSIHCGQCHAAAPHYNGANAQYYQFPNTTFFVDTVVSCGQCHASGDFEANRAILAEYAESRHGVTVNVPGKTSANTLWRGGNTTNASCAVSCHDSGQFQLFLSNRTAPTAANLGVTTTGNAQRKTLSCDSCHSNVATGAIRYYSTGDADSVTITIPNNPALTVSFPDYGPSHLCVTCHSAGRGSWGKGIGAATTSVPTPHYLPQGLTLVGEAGYEFAGRAYPDGFHQAVGRTETLSGSTSGPCVTCHMGSGADHTWEAVTKNSAGQITAITSDTCARCHGTAGMTPAVLDQRRVAFENRLNDLVAALAAKGVTITQTGNWTYNYASLGGATLNLNNAGNWTTFMTEQYPAIVDQATLRPNLIGAMFNLKAFMNSRQDRAAYVHNAGYAYALIADSIDMINDGVINGN